MRSGWPAARPTGHERPRRRQLRLVHVQPRPVPGRAGGGRRRDAQRRRRPARAPARPSDRVARAVHTERGRALDAGGAPLRRKRHAGARRLPRPPIAGAGVRREGRARRAGARQDGRDGSRRQDDLQGPRSPARRGPLPLAGGAPGLGAERARGLGTGGRRNHGSAPPGAARGGSAVPSRVGADTERETDAEEFPRVSNPILTRAIDRVAAGEDLSADEAARVLREVMEGGASEPETAGFLMALRTKGETVQEIAGLAATMRELALPVDAGGDLVDTAGTGGGRPTFNVSTTAAFVAAGAGCRNAQHGNPPATSQCGSADVLEALGARIDLEPDAVARCIEEVGFGFMFAPRHHSAMRYVVPVRKALGVRTIFNFLGPLTNPAGARRQVIGVSDPSMIETMAGALGELGTDRALVVSSADGLDEFSVSGATRVVELKDGRLSTYDVTPEDVGLDPATDGAVGAGTPEENARVLRGVLAGDPGTERALAVMNAAAAIYVGGRAESLREGVERAEESIDSGAAAAKLDGYLEFAR